jgi:hypothetical protein
MKKLQLLLLLLLINGIAFAQDEENEEEDNTEVSLDAYKGFHAGFYAGALFANKYSARLYDGYGVDANGNRNTFTNSVLYQRMRYYGLDSNFTDQIGPAIGVDRDQWAPYWDSTDMPYDLKYTISFLFGIDLQYGLSKTDGIILNANFSKLNVTGTFTLNRPKTMNSSLGDSILFFGISGQEQRFIFQLGYSKLLGEPGRFNFLVEGGLLMNSVKFLSNEAHINSVTIDLTPFTFNQGYQDNYMPREYNAIGFGAFGGFGFNLNMNAKYLIQVIYNPSLEKINTGDAPASKLQQSAGLRVYYNF